MLARNSYIPRFHPSATSVNWSTSVTPAHERWRQKVQEFKAILHYTVGPKLAWDTRAADSQREEN